MSKYVLAFRADPSRDAAPGAEAAWGAWFADLGASVVDAGSRVDSRRAVQDSSPA
jgi:hypothetical protein